MRVLDLGCGKGLSSIFLAKEYLVQVWATDLWINASDNYKRIKADGLTDRVFPIHSDARELPFAEEFFDVIVCVDAYIYFGTDDLYLDYLHRFVKPGGQIGIVGLGTLLSGGTGFGAGQDWWTLNWSRRGRIPGNCGLNGRRPAPPLEATAHRSNLTFRCWRLIRGAIWGSSG
jgi:cyclopropane fatty-acyl-phospholipid synthase-like methyltransferase